MRLFLSYLVWLSLSPMAGSAQQHYGRIYDALSGVPLGKVLITNTRSGALWLGDSAGRLSFTAYPGDLVRFSLKGYKPAEARILDYHDSVSIAMERAPIELKGVEVLSPLTRYKRDSAFFREFYRKELGYATSWSGTGGPMGSGLVSGLAMSLTGQRKRARQFYEAYQTLNEMRYSSIRYTPRLVASQTGLPDSLSERFIVRNPISADFLRVASELELKMRIRELYREELQRDSLRKAEEKLR